VKQKSGLPHSAISFAVERIDSNCFFTIINGRLMLIELTMRCSSVAEVDCISPIQLNGPKNKTLIQHQNTLQILRAYFE
jgi:hypothetical protein